MQLCKMLLLSYCSCQWARNGKPPAFFRVWSISPATVHMQSWNLVESCNAYMCFKRPIFSNSSEVVVKREKQKHLKWLYACEAFVSGKLKKKKTHTVVSYMIFFLVGLIRSDSDTNQTYLSKHTLTIELNDRLDASLMQREIQEIQLNCCTIYEHFPLFLYWDLSSVFINLVQVPLP